MQKTAHVRSTSVLRTRYSAAACPVSRLQFPADCSDCGKSHEGGVQHEAAELGVVGLEVIIWMMEVVISSAMVLCTFKWNHFE